MFNLARLKLTAWYLLIIMLISIIFSTVIFNGANNELQRIEVRQQVRAQQFRDEFIARPDFPEMFEPIQVDEIRQHLVLTLILINLGILIVSGGAGYFLAGKTLEPIKEMIDEQNRFIADASHELRTPITVLKSELEVNLRDKKLSLKDAKHLLVSNLEEVNNLEEISDELLELAQIQRPNNLILETITLKKLSEDAYKKIIPLAEKKNITIQRTAINQSIVADKNRLTEVLIILLDNAIKYSPEKSTVKLTASATNQVAVIQVKDQGIGISAKDLPHIFDRFFRVDMSRTKKGTIGYGLGLSIAKKIVELHNGKIKAESSLGKGTMISVELPLKRSSQIV